MLPAKRKIAIGISSLGLLASSQGALAETHIWDGDTARDPAPVDGILGPSGLYNQAENWAANVTDPPVGTETTPVAGENAIFGLNSSQIGSPVVVAPYTVTFNNPTSIGGHVLIDDDDVTFDLGGGVVNRNGTNGNINVGGMFNVSAATFNPPPAAKLTIKNGTWNQPSSINMEWSVGRIFGVPAGEHSNEGTLVLDNVDLIATGMRAQGLKFLNVGGGAQAQKGTKGTLIVKDSLMDFNDGGNFPINIGRTASQFDTRGAIGSSMEVDNSTIQGRARITIGGNGTSLTIKNGSIVDLQNNPYLLASPGTGSNQEQLLIAGFGTTAVIEGGSKVYARRVQVNASEFGAGNMAAGTSAEGFAAGANVTITGAGTEVNAIFGNVWIGDAAAGNNTNVVTVSNGALLDTYSQTRQNGGGLVPGSWGEAGGASGNVFDGRIQVAAGSSLILDNATLRAGSINLVPVAAKPAPVFEANGTIELLAGIGGTTATLRIQGDGARIVVGGAGQVGLADVTGGYNNGFVGDNTLEFELGAAASYDEMWLSTVGDPSGDTVQISLLNGYVPTVGSFFDLITADGGITGLAGTQLDLSPNPFLEGFLSIESLGGSVQAMRFTVTAVPEPASLGLLALGGLAALRRRRA